MRNLLIPFAVGSYLGVKLFKAFKKKNRKVFISYHYANEAKYKSLLIAWTKNRKFNLTFVDSSTDISINSTNEAAIKRAISRRIKESEIFCCLIGKETHARPIVTWEIKKAKELKKKIIAIKINYRYKSPDALKRSNVIWVKSFKQEAIEKAFMEI